jgi:DNA-binding NarL/FixJ family response regulator
MINPSLLTPESEALRPNSIASEAPKARNEVHPVNSIRILLIEENRVLREGLTSMLNQEPGIGVVGAIGDEENTMAKVRELKPQVVLLDVSMRDQTCLDLVGVIKKEAPAVRTIVMGLYSDQKDIMEFIQLGASGFILKDAAFDDFLRTIKSVAVGESILPPLLAGALFSQVVREASLKGRSALLDRANLTKREREIIDLIAQGLSNKEVARKLNIATHTVKSHVHHILEKLALQTRLQIATFARPRVTLKKEPGEDPTPGT